ncbi:hypothetical protein ABVT39_026411 [Epinephelus coioides]
MKEGERDEDNQWDSEKEKDAITMREATILWASTGKFKSDNNSSHVSLRLHYVALQKHIQYGRVRAIGRSRSVVLRSVAQTECVEIAS